jgi:hypothetical protein
MNTTLMHIFQDVTDEESSRFAGYLGSLQANQATIFTCVDGDDKPIKGGAFEKYEGKYYAYFAKNVFDPSKRLELSDCHTVDELAELAHDPGLKEKCAAHLPEAQGKPQVIGPMTFGEAVTLRKAIEYINHAHALQASGERILHKFTGSGNEPNPRA